MERGYKLLNRLVEDTHMPDKYTLGQPIVEIAGDKRVLIENHIGVQEYGRDKITVKAKYGLINICGSGLELRQMTKEQLVISGRISCVALARKEQK